MQSPLAPHCYLRRLIRVNLSNNKTHKERLPERFLSFLGGRGLGSLYFYREVDKSTDPLSPANKLYFFTGPLTGTPFPGSARCCITTKSPLTEIYLYTIFGGSFGPELKFAGYDGIIVEGKADKPVYMCIIDDEVTIRDAKDYWGMMTSEVTEAILKDVNMGLKVACIGPAGENLVRYASVISHRQAAGRGGAGAVMGAKNLKAIAVHGDKDLALANSDQLKSLTLEIHRKAKENPSLQDYSRYGTACILPVMNEVSILPTKNFQSGFWPAASTIFEELEQRTVKRFSCPHCSVACGKLRLTRNDGEEFLIKGPEYETLYSFGSCCLCKDLGTILEANRLCNEFGLDTISTGVSIAFAMECYEKGLLPTEKIKGLKLEWGSRKAIIELVSKIASRAGLGNLLADGTKKASRVIGRHSEDFAMNVKGLELGGYDPRGAKGQGLAYATSERGGCHHAGGYIVSAEIFGDADRFEEKNKGMLVKELRINQIVFDSAMVCAFYSDIIDFGTLSEAIGYATGFHLDEEELTQIGERIINVERMINVRQGISRKDDTLPLRLLKETVPEGSSKGQTVDLEPMLDDFYEICGWDKNGKPFLTPEGIKAKTNHEQRKCMHRTLK